MSYTFSYINYANERTCVFCRNVSTKNPDSALQFEIEQERGKRNYHHSFALPASEIPKFLAAMQKED